MIDDSVTIEMIHRYLDDMIGTDNIDTLILGCTHYPLLRSVIAREIGGVFASTPGEAREKTTEGKITLVNPAYTTAIELASLLKESGLAAETPVDFQEHQFFVSDGPDSFRSFASEILGLTIDKVSLMLTDQL